MYGFRKRHLIIILLLAFPVVVAFLPLAMTRGIKSNTILIFKTPLTIADAVFGKAMVSLSPKGVFLSKINSQNAQIKSLQAENSYTKELFLENQRLKELLSFKQNLPFKAISAQVIAKDPSNWRHTIIINKGSSSGIKNYNFVVSEYGLVGRICEIGKTAAKAILITDLDFKVAAVCQRSREEMIVSGIGRGLCELKYLPEAADIQIKDLIVTSGLGGFCPKGIVIGEVAVVRKSKDGAIQNALVKPAARLNRLEEVLALSE